MKPIASFTVDHLKLPRGLYVSRKDKVENAILTTFDIRMTSPNNEPVMDTAPMHAIEHLGATYLRNHEQYGDKIVYFGPMGCSTGFSLILAGDYESKDVVDLLTGLYEFIRDFNDEVPGASAECCGNYLDMNLNLAKYWAKEYLNTVLYDISDYNTTYVVL
jgi:S-ribosylhomocysteine lyase